LHLYDLFLDKLYSVNPIEVNIIEDLQTEVAIENDIDENDDTGTIISKYIDNLNNQDLCSIKLKSLMSTLYSEAKELE
jgi:phosphoglycerate-specific signal transduction histidine kinase